MQPYRAGYLPLPSRPRAAPPRRWRRTALTGGLALVGRAAATGAAGVAAYVVVLPVALPGQERSALQGGDAQDHEPRRRGRPPAARHRASRRRQHVGLVLEVDQHIVTSQRLRMSCALLL